MDQVPESIDGNVLKALRELFAFPKSCFNPQGMITKAYSQTQKLYVGTKGHFKVEPASAWPPQYDQNTHQRVSPDITCFKAPDGVWYFADGRRDLSRSPKEAFQIYNPDNKDLKDIVYRQDELTNSVTTSDPDERFEQVPDPNPKILTKEVFRDHSPPEPKVIQTEFRHPKELTDKIYAK